MKKGVDMTLKSGDKVILMSGQYVPWWLDEFAGYVINVYQSRVSVRVPVDDDRIHLASFDEIREPEGDE